MSKEIQLCCTSFRKYCSIDGEKPKAPGGFELRTFGPHGRCSDYFTNTIVLMLLVELSNSRLRHWLSAEVIIVFFVADQRADMAIADLSISYQRELVVDFTMPFLDLGEAGLFYDSNGTPSPIYRLLRWRYSSLMKKDSYFWAKNTSYWCKLQ